jgi:hypothetical protein
VETACPDSSQPGAASAASCSTPGRWDGIALVLLAVACRADVISVIFRSAQPLRC